MGKRKKCCQGQSSAPGPGMGKTRGKCRPVGGTDENPGAQVNRVTKHWYAKRW